jgi:glycosyltransferase involved in cell wall biosynthesis
MVALSKLSVIIITKDEEQNIRDCLESVKWADEIIVLDSGSGDRTIEICREYTKNIFETDWPGFGIQKNRALLKATSEWVLSIDADERVTEELETEIKDILLNGMKTGYEIPRLSNYCGRFMRHGGWWPDRVLRLFKRERGKFTDALIHERLIVDGDLGRLTHHLVHYTFRDLEKVLDTVNRYSTAGALQRFESGKSGGLRKAIAHGLWMFLRTYIIKAGFMDGAEGFMLAVSNAEGAYYKYLKLWMLTHKREQ